MDRNQKILAALIVVFVLILGYRLFNPYEQPTVSKLTYDGQKPAGRSTEPDTASAAPSDALHLATDYYLKPERLKAVAKRDPFSKFRPPAPAATAPKATAPPPKPRTPEDVARDAFKAFKAFGSFSHEEENVLFLQRQKQVILVRKGDLIDGRYAVEDFSEDTVTVTAEELEGPLMIRLEELPDTPGSRFAAGGRPSPVREAPEPPPPPEEFEGEAPESEAEETSPGQTPRAGSVPVPGGGTGLEPSFPQPAGGEEG